MLRHRDSRKLQDKHCAATRRARDSYVAAMFTNDSENDCETESGPDSCGLRREKRIENARRNRGRDARAIVADFELCLVSGVPRRDSNFPAFAAFLNCLARVADEIHEDLLQLPSVAEYAGQCAIELEFDSDFFSCKIEFLQFHRACDDLI